MSAEYETRVTRLTVNKVGEPIFSPFVTHIEIDDEAAGEFLLVTQTNDESKPGQIFIDPDIWPHIKAAIEQLLPTLGNA